MSVAICPISQEALELNAFYLDQLQRRALQTADDCADWLDKVVCVFLRHDAVDTFVVSHQCVAGAYANHVELADARFIVDRAGRQQTLELQGPLPNRHSIHAWLTGTLIAIGSQPPRELPTNLRPVRYNPVDCDTFVFADNHTPVYFSRRVHCVNQQRKVWCE